MLRPKQKLFAELYVELGNASEAARQAYGSDSASTNASKLLKNTEIQAYVAELTQKPEENRIASMEEVLQFYTNVMRGQVVDQNGKQPVVNDRLKAADSLYKRYSAGQERQQATMDKLDTLLTEMKNAAIVDS